MLHYRLRQECFDKAQAAYHSSHRNVALFYSEQGHLHTQKMNEANQRAAAMIVHMRNAGDPNQLDLHLLHVDEAIATLKAFLEERKAEHRADLHYVHVITGHGRHSAGGIARIKPAVINFLNTSNYRFREQHKGMLRVYLK